MTTHYFVLLDGSKPDGLAPVLKGPFVGDKDRVERLIELRYRPLHDTIMHFDNLADALDEFRWHAVRRQHFLAWQAEGGVPDPSFINATIEEVRASILG